jgi:hypothetical protein
MQPAAETPLPKKGYLTARRWLQERLENDCVLIDGLDSCLIGYSYCQARGNTAVYDVDLCLRLLRNQGFSEQAALEYFTTEIEGAWIGNRSPVFLRRIPVRLLRRSVFPKRSAKP